MLIKIIVALLIIAACLVLYASTKPDDFSVSRSALISAPAEKTWALVNDFHKWNDWSPWAKIDPAAKNSYDGPDAGIGAGFAWDGNHKVGAGRMTITESEPGERIRIRLEFFKPMKAVNDTLFTFAPENGQTRVTWTMSGKSNIVSKLMCLVMGDMDKMVGGQFEQGLTDIKRLAEAA